MALLEPRSLAEARDQLGRGGSVLVAGGVGVGLQLRERSLPAGTDLVTLRRVEQAGLRQIGAADDAVVIGALCTHAELARDPLLHDRLPGLPAVFGALGNHRVRSQGTLGGNLATADPNHDPAVALGALRASVCIDTAGGDRVQPLVTAAAPVIGPGEVLTKVIVPALPPCWHLRYQKVTTAAGVAAGLVSVAVLGPGGALPAGTDLAALEVVVGCVGPHPLALPRCAAAARRAVLGAGAIEDVQRAANDELAAAGADDLSSEHRRHVAAVLIRRMVEQIVRGADG